MKEEVSTYEEAPSLAETEVGVSGGGVGKRGWGGGIFRAMKESAATGLQRAKRRDSRTEDQ